MLSVNTFPKKKVHVKKTGPHCSTSEGAVWQRMAMESNNDDNGERFCTLVGRVLDGIMELII